LPLYDVPAVAGVLTPGQCRQTATSIAATQESSGAIPWFDGGHTDPWDHVESAMALTAAGLLEPAQAAFEWSRRTQRSDGSWPLQMRAGTIEDANSDSNFCAYVATGVWHHVVITADRRFAHLQLQAEALQYFARLRNDFRPDAVTGQERKLHQKYQGNRALRRASKARILSAWRSVRPISSSPFSSEYLRNASISKRMVCAP